MWTAFLKPHQSWRCPRSRGLVVLGLGPSPLGRMCLPSWGAGGGTSSVKMHAGGVTSQGSGGAFIFTRSRGENGKPPAPGKSRGSTRERCLCGAGTQHRLAWAPCPVNPTRNPEAVGGRSACDPLPTGTDGDSDVPTTPSHLKTFSWGLASSQPKHTVWLFPFDFYFIGS